MNQDNMEFYFRLFNTILIYSTAAVTMNILLGYLGILYLGHPAIFGIGAYTFAISMLDHGLSFFPALLLGGFAAMLASFILSLPALRLKSHYIGMTTFAFLIIVNSLFLNLRDLTRGGLGIPGIPRPTIFGKTLLSQADFFPVVLIITLIIMLILYRVLHSPFSRVIETIREDETSAKTLGKNHVKYKIQAFLIAGFFGGIAGGLLASEVRFINPGTFSTDQLITMLAIVIVGGMGSFWGSILGAIIITMIPEILRFLTVPTGYEGPIRLMIYGLVIIFFMIFRPNGLLGKRTNIFSK